MKKLFITGTDTDCGKTYVTCRLLSYLNQFSTALALKPVATGYSEVNGQQINEDIAKLSYYNSNQKIIINQWLFKPPIAPHLAAKEAGITMDASLIAAFCNRPELSKFNYLLIEGAGGLLVPLNEQETWLDFLSLMKIPVLIVVGLKLGCINHALLTAEVLKRYKIPCWGWVANFIDPMMMYRDENIETLKKALEVPLLAKVEYNGNFISEFNQASLFI